MVPLPKQAERDVWLVVPGAHGFPPTIRDLEELSLARELMGTDQSYLCVISEYEASSAASDERFEPTRLASRCAELRQILVADQEADEVGSPLRQFFYINSLPCLVGITIAGRVMVVVVRQIPGSWTAATPVASAYQLIGELIRKGMSDAAVNLDSARQGIVDAMWTVSVDELQGTLSDLARRGSDVQESGGVEMGKTFFWRSAGLPGQSKGNGISCARYSRRKVH